MNESVARWAGFVAMAVIWGLTWLPMKLAAEAVPPMFFASVRFLLAGGLFLGFAAATGRSLAWPRPGRLAASTLLLSTVAFGLLFWGTARVPTGLAAVVNLSLVPISAMLFEALFGQARLTARRIGTAALGVVGLAALFGARPGLSGPEAGGDALGLAAIAVGTCSYGLGALVSRPLARAMPIAALAGWQLLGGGLTLLPVSLAIEGLAPGQVAALLDGRVLLGLAVLVGGGSLVAFPIYLWLVRDWGPFRAGLYAFVSPLIAIAVGIGWAGERIGGPELAGMALMLGATALALSEGRAAAATGSSPGRPA